MASKGETDFIDQFTRKLMVDLCRSQVLTGSPYKGLTIALKAQAGITNSDDGPFVAYAITKKWLSKDGSKVIAGGWGTGARFLKR
jgi:hypothetical protein